MRKRIVVIGGGMAGAAAAHTLKKHGYDVTIVEKNDYVGGRMHSVSGGGATFELGAGFMTNSYTNVFKLLHEFALSGYLQTRKSQGAIMRSGIPCPTSRQNLFANSRLITLSARGRLLSNLLELIPKWKRFDVHKVWQTYPHGTKTVTEKFSGSGGKELVDYLVQPILEGYFYWSAERTSEAMWLLVLKTLLGPTYVLPEGLQRIPERVSKDCDVLLSHHVERVAMRSNGMYDVVVVTNGQTKTLQFDAVVCATTASTVPEIITGLSKEQLAFFSGVSYTSTVVLAQVYQPSISVKNQATAYPRTEGGPLASVTISNSETAVITKAYASGLAGPKLVTESDKKIITVLSGSVDVPSSFGESTFEYVQRWPEALPEFSPEHVERVRVFAAGGVESKTDKLVFAGDYIGGPFIEGALTSGIEAAERLHKRLAIGVGTR